MCISIAPAAHPRAVSVEVSTSFLLEDAQKLGTAIADAAPGTEIDVDFRDVRECQAPALARLAEAMRSGHAHVALHGISEHHRKLLGYLGAPPDGGGRSAAARS